jgi:Leucine-rich repeat (LRR) protein
VLPIQLFSQNTKILILNASYNKLKDLQTEQICSLKDLQTIDFSYNDFKEIPNDFFQPAKRIKTIDFSNCKFKEISTDLFNDLDCLQYVDFSCNKIVNLSKHLFEEKTGFLVDFRNNIDTNDLNVLWNLFFDYYTKFSLSPTLFYKYSLFETIIASENLGKKIYYIVIVLHLI